MTKLKVKEMSKDYQEEIHKRKKKSTNGQEVNEKMFNFIRKRKLKPCDPALAREGLG